MMPVLLPFKSALLPPCTCILFQVTYFFQESSLGDHYAIKAMNALFDMLERSFIADAARTDNADLIWSSNLKEAIAQRGKAREAAAKLRLQEAEQAEKELVQAVQQAFDEPREGIE
jgi:hypothetical protein